MGANNADFQSGISHDYLKNPDDYVILHRGIGHGYRGLPQTEDDFKNIGMHWTTDYKIAGHFAVGNPWSLGERDNPEDGGHIITAAVHKGGIIERKSPEWKQIAENLRIEGWSDDDSYNAPLDEKEVTVRRGTPVHVLRVTPVKDFYEVASPALKNLSEHTIRQRFGTETWGDYQPFLADPDVKSGSYLKKGSGEA